MKGLLLQRVKIRHFHTREPKRWRAGVITQRYDVQYVTQPWRLNAMNDYKIPKSYERRL